MIWTCHKARSAIYPQPRHPIVKKPKPRSTRSCSEYVSAFVSGVVNLKPWVVSESKGKNLDPPFLFQKRGDLFLRGASNRDIEKFGRSLLHRFRSRRLLFSTSQVASNSEATLRSRSRLATFCRMPLTFGQRIFVRRWTGFAARICS